MYKYDFFLEANLENDSGAQSKEADLHDLANSLIEANLINTWQVEVRAQDDKFIRFHLGVFADDADPKNILKSLRASAENIEFFNITLEDYQNNNFIKMRR